jgi:DNA-binding XRE family transcriptional regulator
MEKKEKKEKKVKKELDHIKELAKLYYLRGDTQKMIAEKIGISRVTMGAWVKNGNWDTLRTANMVTRKELIAKMMKNASEKLEKGEMSYDEMSKLASTIEKLDKKANIVTIIEVFTAYNQWLIARMQLDPDITPELVKTMNKYQDMFINERLKGIKIEAE